LWVPARIQKLLYFDPRTVRRRDVKVSDLVRRVFADRPVDVESALQCQRVPGLHVGRDDGQDGAVRVLVGRFAKPPEAAGAYPKDEASTLIEREPEPESVPIEAKDFVKAAAPQEGHCLSDVQRLHGLN
jgi:hypothetical protein